MFTLYRNPFQIHFVSGKTLLFAKNPQSIAKRYAFQKFNSIGLLSTRKALARVQTNDFHSEEETYLAQKPNIETFLLSELSVTVFLCYCFCVYCLCERAGGQYRSNFRQVAIKISIAHNPIDIKDRHRCTECVWFRRKSHSPDNRNPDEALSRNRNGRRTAEVRYFDSDDRWGLRYLIYKKNYAWITLHGTCLAIANDILDGVVIFRRSLDTMVSKTTCECKYVICEI